MNTRIAVGVVFGGMSAEHEVSWESARNVISAMDQDRYDTIPIYIDMQGRWYLLDPGTILPGQIPNSIPDEHRVFLAPDRSKGRLLDYHGRETRKTVDILFPVLHGPYGEDGSFQGLCRIYHIPFVGAGVVGSAVSMDKDVMKRLLRDRGIPVPKFTVVHFEDRHRVSYKQICEELGLPLFVKPANLGSSVGISKVVTSDELEAAMETAWQYDRKILVEECILGREIECSVLGNWNPIASLPGEIIPRHEFYSYEAKYLDSDGAQLKIPAMLPENITQKVQHLAIETFKTLCCEGMGRVDFFLRGSEELLVNELNSIPGFTNISMYPKLWEASGISYAELIDRLIELALERFGVETHLSRSRSLHSPSKDPTVKNS